MATRDLARSAVEGGRRGRDMEYWDSRSNRQRARITLASVRTLEDAWHAEPEEFTSGCWGSEFTDQLNPTRRFLEARAGRPWNAVWSELCRRYDRRTLKGWHLLRHVKLQLIEGRYGARVDEHGILRYRQRRPWSTAP